MIKKGAEAIIYTENFLGIKTIIKKRNQKLYRIKEIDEKLRIQRTRREARLLHKVKKIGIITPVVLEVGKDFIRMEFIEGKKAKGFEFELGKILGKLHNANIIHGDFTPNNVIYANNKFVVIDFGLGFISKRIEDKADDVVVALYSIERKNKFIKGYTSTCKDAKEILDRVNTILKRVRYA